jgi:hypothetical protein
VVQEALAGVLGLERVLALVVLLVQADSALDLVEHRLRVKRLVRRGLRVRRVVVAVSNIRRPRKAR